MKSIPTKIKNVTDNLELSACIGHNINNDLQIILVHLYKLKKKGEWNHELEVVSERLRNIELFTRELIDHVRSNE